MKKNQIFKRSFKNPILGPNSTHFWENKKLYNPGAIVHEGKIHLYYRAIGDSEDWSSVIGYAFSDVDDGEDFIRFDDPLLKGEGKLEKRGLEDPRIVKIEDTFYMTCAAYAGPGEGVRLKVLTSQYPHKDWQKHGFALPNFDYRRDGGFFVRWGENGPVKKEPNNIPRSKAGAIFPETINGKFYMLFGEHRVWMAESKDGITWESDKQPFLSPRDEEYFDNFFVEAGPPPIKTDQGWLVLYHGIDKRMTYRLGYLILDLENPRKVIYKSQNPIFGPQESYELSGIVDVLPIGLKEINLMTRNKWNNYLDRAMKEGFMPQVTFCCAAILIKDEVRIYYGASDSVICTAVAPLKKILDVE